MARARLKAMVAADSVPVLSAEELTSLLSLSALADSTDLLPSDTDWTPTYDLNRGAAEGWRWKAAKLAGDYDFSADGATFSRSQARAHCVDMALHYTHRILSSAPVYAAIAAAYPVDEETE